MDKVNYIKELDSLKKTINNNEHKIKDLNYTNDQIINQN